MSRLAHRAFFLTGEERTRAVALMRRVEEFCGVLVLAYAFMDNHFHIYIYVPDAEEIGEDELLRRMWNSSAFMRTFKQHFTMSCGLPLHVWFGRRLAGSASRGGGDKKQNTLHSLLFGAVAGGGLD